jgi:uncharacterized protein YdhG (YjbR/CyaY superfamily)
VKAFRKRKAFFVYMNCFLFSMMQSKAQHIEDYVKELPENRIGPITKLRQTILQHIPEGFEECMSYGMIGYVVPHSIYPKGYHVNPNLPLPFVSIASQKNCIAFYHMGLYGNHALLNWFVTEYPNHNKTKLDMGKGCVRFKKIDQIPYDLIAALLHKISVADWIMLYEDNLKR